MADGPPVPAGGLFVPDVAGADVLSAALAYAERGWYVVPVRGGTKHPGSLLGDGWPRKSSRAPDVVAAWFIGTGHGLALHVGRSGAVVFDVDHPDRLPPPLQQALAGCVPPHQATRPTTCPGRGHYVFTTPAGRSLSNSLGRLGGGWGEVRGANGVIVVQPSVHPDGGCYRWLRTGPVPELPADLAGLLVDAHPAAEAATDAAVAAFLATYRGASSPGELRGPLTWFAARVAAGESRHQTAVSVLVWALEEARAGFYPAADAVEQIRAAFTDAIGGERPVGSEYAGIVAWAVAQAHASDLTRVYRREAEAGERRTAELYELAGRAGQPPAVDPTTGEAAGDGPREAPATLDDVHTAYRRWLGDSYDLTALDVVLAVAAAERLTGDPPWLLVVGGSGAAKTETITPLAGAGAHVTSTIASEGALLSATARKERAKTAHGGLLRKIGDRGILVIKDFTSVIAMHRDLRATVLAALREIHDGYWERNVGADGGLTLTWDGRIVLVGATTTAYDTAHTVISAMGDRFVLVRLDSATANVRQAAGRRALANTRYEAQMRAELTAGVGRLLAAVDPTGDYLLDEEVVARLLAAADLVTWARTAVERDYRGEVVDAHAPEMPTRFAKMLGQIVRGGLALGMPVEQATARALRAARDSMPPLRLQVLEDVAAHPRSTTADVVTRVQKPRTTVDRVLQELHILGLLAQGQAERSLAWCYTVAPGVTVADLAMPAYPDGFTRNVSTRGMGGQEERPPRGDRVPLVTDISGDGAGVSRHTPLSIPPAGGLLFDDPADETNIDETNIAEAPSTLTSPTAPAAACWICASPLDPADDRRLGGRALCRQCRPQ